MIFILALYWLTLIVHFQQLTRLRDDLMRVRSLADSTHKREILKRDQFEALQDLLTCAFFPHEPPMRSTFEKIMS